METNETYRLEKTSPRNKQYKVNWIQVETNETSGLEKTSGLPYTEQLNSLYSKDGSSL